MTDQTPSLALVVAVVGFWVVLAMLAAVVARACGA